LGDHEVFGTSALHRDRLRLKDRVVLGQGGHVSVLGYIELGSGNGALVEERLFASQVLLGRVQVALRRLDLPVDLNAFLRPCAGLGLLEQSLSRPKLRLGRADGG
jgi:hypothetical protein